MTDAILLVPLVGLALFVGRHVLGILGEDLEDFWSAAMIVSVVLLAAVPRVGFQLVRPPRFFGRDDAGHAVEDRRVVAD